MQLRRDPFTQRLIAIAPGREQRPGAAAPVEDGTASCPFCAGHEDRTPPETLRYGDPWRLRVVPNKYPELPKQEVVVHCPDHRSSLADLDGEELELVARAWQERARAAREDGFAYVHAFVNEGREAGSSLRHSHSQLVPLRERPPGLLREHGPLRWNPAQVVVAGEGVVAFSPYGARLAYETWIAPEETDADAFASELLAPALGLAAAVIARLGRLLGARPPVNLWLHDGDHWHLELLPRLSVPAGLELGAEIYVNSVAPEAAAERLRGA